MKLALERMVRGDNWRPISGEGCRRFWDWPPIDLGARAAHRIDEPVEAEQCGKFGIVAENCGKPLLNLAQRVRRAAPRGEPLGIVSGAARLKRAAVQKSTGLLPQRTHCYWCRPVDMATR